MRGSGVLAAAMAAWVLSPAVAAAQPSARLAEAHYQKAYALYKSKPPDYANAAIWCRKAAELGHGAAQNDLGWFYQNGWGVPRDLAQVYRPRFRGHRVDGNCGLMIGAAGLTVLLGGVDGAPPVMTHRARAHSAPLSTRAIR